MSDPAQPNDQPNDAGLTPPPVAPPIAPPAPPYGAPVPPYAGAQPPVYPGAAGQTPYQPPAYPPPAYGAPSGPPAYAAPSAPPAAGGYPAGGYAPTAYGAPYGYPAVRTNALAVTSMISSIVGFAFAWTGFLALGVIVGVITGHIALSQIGRTREKGRGMALAGVIVGWIGVAIGLLILVVFGLFVTTSPSSFALTS